MPADTTRQPEYQPDEILKRLGQLEAMVKQLVSLLPSWPPLPWPAKDYVLVVTSKELYLTDWGRSLLHPEPTEKPVPPWNHLVARRHPWRKQLYVKGRNMTVRQLLGTVKANKLTPEAAARNFDLPEEAIHEALAYAEKNQELLKAEAEIERLMLVRGGYDRGAQTVPR